MSASAPDLHFRPGTNAVIEAGTQIDAHGDGWSCEDREAARLRALQDLDLLDTPESEGFDRITRMAARLFRTPISAVSLTDYDRQWFKSSVGTSGRQIPRLGAPCAEVTRSRQPLVIPDMHLDAVFSTCLLAEAGIRFYAGSPLTTRNGHVLGAFCVLDKTPREVSAEEMASLHDFAAMVIAQIELEHDFGRVDPLSGLPNRNQLVEDLADLQRNNPDGQRLILLVDVADPKNFNRLVSVLGTVYIDNLVQASCSAIRETLGRRSGMYHVGAAAFAIVMDEQNGDTCEEVIERLTARLKKPVLCNGIPVTINAAFGISPFVFNQSMPRDVLRTALSAAHDAREAETKTSVYSRDRDEANRRHVMLLTDMREALEASTQFALQYQPRIELQTGGCVGAEALLRWNNPRMGNIPPGEFIPLAEQTALSGHVTKWVIEEALGQIADWRAKGIHGCVSINISAPNLEQPDFASSFAARLQAFEVPANSVELEFTEGVFIRNRSQVLAQLNEIRSMGTDLAIDDFGTGYSSLSYLQHLPVTTVKIDQSFIRNLPDSPRDQLLVRMIINIAHDMGCRVVAEGVETVEAYDLLHGFGCDEVQGYLISRPLLPKIFETWFCERPDRSAIASLRTLPGLLQ